MSNTEHDHRTALLTDAWNRFAWVMDDYLRCLSGAYDTMPHAVPRFRDEEERRQHMGQLAWALKRVPEDEAPFVHKVLELEYLRLMPQRAGTPYQDPPLARKKAAQ